MKKSIVSIIVFFMLFIMIGCSNNNTEPTINDGLGMNRDESSKGQEDDKLDSDQNNESDENDRRESQEDTVSNQEENETNISEESYDGEAEYNEEQNGTEHVSASGKATSNSDKDFIDMEPLHNVPNDKVFTIKLNLSDEPFATFQIEEYFKVFKDRECTEGLLVDVKYDDVNNTITIRPDERSWAMYPREEIDSEDELTWGGLQTYYLKIDHDITATTATKLDQPIRMMFTIASPIDIPTVKAKFNQEGNLTLYWEQIDGATEYKVYRGSEYGMRQLAVTTDNKFILTEEEYGELSMNTMLSDVYDYSVVAVNGSTESRLSNIIKGKDYSGNAPLEIDYDTTTKYTWDDIDTLLDLPKKIEVNMVQSIPEEGRQVTKSYPVIWDFRNPITDDFGYTEYIGKVLGTTFILKFIPNDQLPSEAEIAEFEDSGSAVANGVTTDVEDQIDIPNAPSNDEVKDETSETDITSDIKESENQESKEDLETMLANNIINHETNIDLSLYPEARDGAYLTDMLIKIQIQYPLILDKVRMRTDYANDLLIVEYSGSKEDTIKKQNEIKEKVKAVVSEVITSDMTIVEKEKALHDWLLDNARYHDEVLEAYLNGEDIEKIAKENTDSFNPYGVLINGVGVCQSYAEAYKLLCDEANVQSIVMTGDLGSVPHAWNKVKIDDSWYHVDATNNDGDGAIPYAVFNASDALTAADFSMNKNFAIDKDIENYLSDNNDKDYYFKEGKFADSEAKLQELFEEGMSSGKDFFVKVTPSIEDATIEELLFEAYGNYGDKDKNPMYGKMFNIVFVIYQ